MATKTKDGLTIYDLDPQASELVVVAGPAGYEVSAIAADDLPQGFRWVSAREWSQLQLKDDPQAVEGILVQHDASGQGHAWRTIDASELPASIREEIETEIIDGNDDPDCYVAGNGEHYRW